MCLGLFDKLFGFLWFVCKIFLFVFFMFVTPLAAQAELFEVDPLNIQVPAQTGMQFFI